MATGAASAVTGANAHNQTGYDQQRKVCINDHRWEGGNQCPGGGGDEHAEDKGNAPAAIHGCRAQQPADDTADAGDAAIGMQQPQGGQADKAAAGE